ncbi:MAG TPA: hypothetical protein VFW25_02720 [Silvibacterium sp.]|nr:hypothetical protein [Silvibacterium sp.]
MNKFALSPARTLLRRTSGLVLAVLALFLPSVAPAQDHTNPLNRDPAVLDAFQHFYNMDYDGALARFKEIRAAHPSDPIATDYVLHTILFRELFRLDLLDTTFYANDGFLTGKHTISENPAVRDQIKSMAGHAIDQADEELKSDPKNVNALFARGWARSLEAAYLAMVDRSFGAALKLALGAKSDDARVLQLDPDYVDAKLVIGIYQYVLGALPLGAKLLFGFAGMHGSKSAGIATLQDAASRGLLTSVEARTSMTLFLRREGKYQQALAVNSTLLAQYPRNFLFCLEDANITKDLGRGMDAINLYRRLIAEAQHPGYFASSHLELAFYGLGDTLRGQRLYSQAADAFQKAAFQPSTSPELKRRSLLAAGETYDLMNQRDKARREYQAIIAAGGNSTQSDLAHKYMDKPYRGK